MYSAAPHTTEQLSKIINLNTRYLYLEIIFASVLGGIMGFNSAFAIRLGATPFLNAILYSAPALISALGSIPSARFLASRIRRRLWLFGSLFALRLGYLVVAMMPLIMRQNTATWLVIWIVVLNLPTILFTNGWHVLLGELIPESRRAFVISRRQILWSIGLVVVSAGSGAWLDRLPFPYNYQLLYVFGFITVLGSQYFVQRLIFPTQIPSLPTESVETARVVKLRTGIRRMIINTLIYQIGLSLPASLFNVYYIGTLKTTDGWIGLNSAAASAGVIVGYFFWERLLRHKSYGWVQRRATLLTWLFPVTLAFATNLNIIMFFNFLVNVMHGGVDLSNFNVLLKISKPHERAAYVSWYNTSVQLGTFIAPLLGAWLSEHIGITTALVLAGLIRVLGGILFNIFRVDTDVDANNDAAALSVVGQASDQA